MKSWNRPGVPTLPSTGIVPRVWDTSSATLVEARPDRIAGIYVCGITPYDATHIGHAATYLAYDTIIRLWLDAGLDVHYVQNVTDVDDPLLERATATGVDWRDLAGSQIDLFRGDMEALAIIPPDHYVAVTEMISPTADAVKNLVDSGIGYYVDRDIYFDSSAASASSPWSLGDESGLGREEMLRLSAERGGDPDRIGKRDALDPLLWRGARAGEPSWDTVLGAGRPGWHIECAVIAAQHLGLPFAIQAGGSDLAFPHHEFSAGHAAALTQHSLAECYSHAGLVAYQGEKMSKSLGNLVFVSKLLESGVDARAIRLALLSQNYRGEWEWTEAILREAEDRLRSWLQWAESSPLATPDAAVLANSNEPTAFITELRGILSEDVNTAGALAAIDATIAAGSTAADVDLAAIDALLGIRLC
ncbi:MAG TPA: cysteine--1-D-myo-inosityl 2-amino-2-deoxy-alpha-D-glucopyranoside ligase [Glaciihabitans sp.]|nr:cysteine--1-D-myo-inosityl 2-amino-2-deoxy-alpha-D-glucopyranoside ligase [Glaciihabitans sp.]